MTGGGFRARRRPRAPRRATTGLGASSAAAPSTAPSATPSSTTTSAPAASSADPSGPFAALGRAPGGVVTLERSPSQKLRDLGEGRYALDALGAVCPFPLIEAKDVMGTLGRGDRLVIDFDCTQATEAIPQWAATDGHEVLEFTQRGEASWRIVLQKG